VDEMVNIKSPVEQNLAKVACISNHFNEIPPIIGFIVADQYGNTILRIEYNLDENREYGPISSYLTAEDKNLLSFDLITMYLSSFKSFACQTKIDNVSHLEIHGTSIKISIFFLTYDYILMIFLNSRTYIHKNFQSYILNYFEEKFQKYKYEFTNFNESKSKRLLALIAVRGANWLQKINHYYLHKYQNQYLSNHLVIEELIEEIDPIIKKALQNYLEHFPDDIICDLTKELSHKIHNILLKFKINLEAPQMNPKYPK
jgi:hypothetical protein